MHSDLISVRGRFNSRQEPSATFIRANPVLDESK